MKMRPLLFLLSMAIATVPALEKVCDLRCATASVLPTATANGTHHCPEMPENPNPAPDSRDKGDPCGHGHSGGALLGSVGSRGATDGGYRAAPALFSSPGSFERAGLADAGPVHPVRSAESPPRSAASSILRL